jgi:hypothetical protein
VAWHSISWLPLPNVENSNGMIRHHMTGTDRLWMARRDGYQTGCKLMTSNDWVYPGVALRSADLIGFRTQQRVQRLLVARSHYLIHMALQLALINSQRYSEQTSQSRPSSFCPMARRAS